MDGRGVGVCGWERGFWGISREDDDVAGEEVTVGKYKLRICISIGFGKGRDGEVRKLDRGLTHPILPKAGSIA